MKTFVLAKEHNGFRKCSENPKGCWSAHMAKPSTDEVYSAKQNVKAELQAYAHKHP